MEVQSDQDLLPKCVLVKKVKGIPERLKDVSAHDLEKIAYVFARG